jgi:hypothetical protein
MYINKYNCKKATGWVWCICLDTKQEGWVPEWAFVSKSRRCPVSSRGPPLSVSPWWKLHKPKFKAESVPENSKAESVRTPLSRHRERPSPEGRTDGSIEGCVRKIYGRTGYQVDLIEFHMRNNSVLKWGIHGGDKSQTVRLEKDELIISVTQVEKGEYLGACVTLETSKGHQINLEGSIPTGKKWRTHSYTVVSGQQICSIGFEGSKLTFVETLPANGKGDPRRIMLDEEISPDQSDQSQKRKRARNEIPPPPQFTG